MKLPLGALGLCLLVACSAPPKPPLAKGDYRPINRVEVKAVPSATVIPHTELSE
jgi:hypothetical protein